MSRTGNLLRNTFWGIAGKAVSLLMNFASRTVFIYYLGNVYLGVNGLYTEILSVLSFAELGFGSALIYALYAPVAHNDKEKTLQLLQFYKKIYRVIVVAIAILGLALLPFLQYLVKGAEKVTLFELRLYYLFFLVNTITSYFITYKYSYVNALQKNYICTNFETIANMAIVVIQILVIIFTQNYLAYLATHLLLVIVTKAILVLYLNRRFPILKEKPQLSLDRESKSNIYHDARRLAVGQLSSVAIHSTDNIIISSLSGLGVIGVGMVGNYTLLMNSILGFVLVLFQSATSSFGNIVATSSAAHYRDSFWEMNFLNFWIYGFCSIAFYVLIPPFITLWLGKEYLIDQISFLLIIINCYLQGQSTVYAFCRAAKGNFGVDLAPSILQTIVNLIVSIVAAEKFGLVGVYVGTVASRLVYVIGRPLLGFKKIFGLSSVEYFKRFSIYFAAVLLACIVTITCTNTILQEVTLLRFFMAVLTVALVPNAVIGVLFFRTRDFINVVGRIKNVLRSVYHA